MEIWLEFLAILVGTSHPTLDQVGLGLGRCNSLAWGRGRGKVTGHVRPRNLIKVFFPCQG